MDEETIKAANETFEKICAVLDARKWHYTKEGERKLTFEVYGEDLPMRFNIYVDADRRLVRMHSPLPLRFPENALDVGAIATSEINYKLADGSFDYDMDSGGVCFRLTTSFCSSLISEAVFDYMVHCACSTVDDYNDRLFFLAKESLTLESFLETL